MNEDRAEKILDIIESQLVDIVFDSAVKNAVVSQIKEAEREAVRGIDMKASTQASPPPARWRRGLR